jgi:hypothetical protein
MKRTYRELSDSTKQKISVAMKQYHTNKTAAQTQRTSERQSQSMKNYWKTIPSKEKTTPYYNNI